MARHSSAAVGLLVLLNIAAIVLGSLFPINNTTSNNFSRQYRFSLRVHNNVSTISTFEPDFNQTWRSAFDGHTLYRTRRQANNNPEEGLDPWLFEGDILNRDPRETPAGGDSAAGLAFAAVRSEAQRWGVGPGNFAIVPYKFHPSVRDRAKGIIRGVMDEFQKVCVKWQERTANDKLYVEIISPGSPVCAATIGKRATENNVVYLQKGKIMHELMHVLGFYHEQSRDDRDQFVTIFWDNIEEKAKSNFKAYTAVDVDHLGFPYDYNSLMHYPVNAFSADHQNPTIKPLRDLPPGTTIGQRVTFSQSDLGKLRNLFKCSLQCDAQQFKCVEGSQCIPASQKCDGIAQCNDGSDENNCQPRCTEHQFACPNNKCIPTSWICDGARDCSDGSDENPAKCPKTCTSQEFRCQVGPICIPLYKKCNGQRDCADGEDETDKTCPPPPRKVQQQTVGDLCSVPQYYQQYYQYCFFNYRQRRQYQQNPYFDPYQGFFQFDPIVGGVINLACGLPTNVIGNPQVKLDFDFIMQNALCNNLIIHSAIIKPDNRNAPHVSLPAASDSFVRSLRAKVKKLETSKKSRNSTSPRKMEIYLAVGGRGVTRLLEDWVRQGPLQVERFANTTRTYARSLDVDGVVLDWHSSDIGPLLTLVKQLEKAVRTDPAKNPSTIDLLLGVIITDGLVKSQDENKLALTDLTKAVDYVMYSSSTQGEARDYESLQPNNKFFMDTLQTGLPLNPGGAGGAAKDILEIGKKFFLPLHLGAKHYASNPDEANVFDAYALGPAFLGTLSQDPGRQSAAEACAMFDKPSFIKETREAYQGDSVSHEPVAYRKAKDFASYETPCSLAEKILFFQQKYRAGGKADGEQMFAGIYVPDISLDDTKGTCTNGAVAHGLLSVVSQAVSTIQIKAMYEECKQANDYTWKLTLSKLIMEGLSENGDKSSSDDKISILPGLASDSIR